MRLSGELETIVDHLPGESNLGVAFSVITDTSLRCELSPPHSVDDPTSRLSIGCRNMSGEDACSEDCGLPCVPQCGLQTMNLREYTPMLSGTLPSSISSLSKLERL